MQANTSLTAVLSALGVSPCTDGTGSRQRARRGHSSGLAGNAGAGGQRSRGRPERPPGLAAADLQHAPTTAAAAGAGAAAGAAVSHGPESDQSGSGTAAAERVAGWKQRTIEDMAQLAPSKLAQLLARSIITLLREHQLLPPAAQLCGAGREPDAGELARWRVPTTSSAVKASAAAAATSSTAAAAVAATSSTAVVEAATQSAVAAGGLDTAAGGGGTPAAAITEACSSASKAVASQAGCGCGGSCAEPRASLQWPPELPLVDYQQVSCPSATYEGVIRWAQAQVAAHGAGWCGGDMQQLLAKHQQAVELRASKQVRNCLGLMHMCSVFWRYFCCGDQPMGDRACAELLGCPVCMWTHMLRGCIGST
jgi:hypothetical protein